MTLKKFDSFYALNYIFVMVTCTASKLVHTVCEPKRPLAFSVATPWSALMHLIGHSWRLTVYERRSANADESVSGEMVNAEFAATSDGWRRHWVLACPTEVEENEWLNDILLETTQKTLTPDVSTRMSTKSGHLSLDSEDIGISRRFKSRIGSIVTALRKKKSFISQALIDSGMPKTGS